MSTYNVQMAQLAADGFLRRAHIQRLEKNDRDIVANLLVRREQNEKILIDDSLFQVAHVIFRWDKSGQLRTWIEFQLDIEDCPLAILRKIERRFEENPAQYLRVNRGELEEASEPDFGKVYRPSDQTHTYDSWMRVNLHKWFGRRSLALSPYAGEQYLPHVKQQDVCSETCTQVGEDAAACYGHYRDMALQVIEKLLEI